MVEQSLNLCMASLKFFLPPSAEFEIKLYCSQLIIYNFQCQHIGNIKCFYLLIYL